MTRGLLLVALIGALLLACSSAASAYTIQLPDGRQAEVQARTPPAPGAQQGLSPFSSPTQRIAARDPSGNVAYQGGPVLHTVAPYLIFWDPPETGHPNGQISAQDRALMQRYLTDTAAYTAEGDTYGVGRQYYDSSGYADAGQRFSAAQAIVDTQAYPATNTSICPTVTTPYTHCLTDAQVTAEITRLISAQSLPTGTGANAPVYFVVLPQATNECDIATDCASSAFCAYHSSYGSGAGTVLYSIIPFAVFNFGAKGCQADGHPTVYQSPNGGLQAEQINDNLSHELNETITDPLGDGWINSQLGGDGMELADNCQSYGATADPANGYSPNAYEPTLGGSATPVAPATWGTLYDQLINGDQYYTQTLWSNGDADCEASPTPATLTASFTLPATAQTGSSVTIDPTASVAAAGFSSETWSFGDGATSFSHGSSPGAAFSPAAVTHSFSQLGSYTVKLTLVDANGNASTVSHTITVGSPPTAAFTAPAAQAGQAATFDGSGSTDPNQGASISGYSWDFGDGVTSDGSSASVPHTYVQAGQYTVTLTVTDSLGLASAQVSHVVTVNPAAAPTTTTATTTTPTRSTTTTTTTPPRSKPAIPAPTQSGSTVTLRLALPARQQTTKLYLAFQDGASFGARVPVATIARYLTITSAGKRLSFKIVKISAPHGRLWIQLSKPANALVLKISVRKLSLTGALTRYLKAHHLKTVSAGFKATTTGGHTYSVSFRVRPG